MSIFIVLESEQTLGADVQVLLPHRADGISLNLGRPLNVVVKCWIRLFHLSNTVSSKSMHLIYPFLCVSRVCGWFTWVAQILLQNNKQCRLIATVPATEQKQFLQKYAANDWVSSSLSGSVCTHLCVRARL